MTMGLVGTYVRTARSERLIVQSNIPTNEQGRKEQREEEVSK